MHPRLIAATALLAAALPASAQQADSGAFIVRIGTDTLSVERYVRTADRLVMEAVQRSPSTMVHRLTMTTGPRGRVTGGEWTVSGPRSAEPMLRRTVRMQGDSAIVTTTQAGSSREARVAAGDAILMAGPFYTPYEVAIMRALAGGRMRAEQVLLAGTALATIPVERIGRDSVALQNQFGEGLRGRIDASGRILHLQTAALTTVERVPWLDLEAMARQFAARDDAGRGLGPLSPRSTSRTRIGAANVWLDYSRPAMRGRPVWGTLVPLGEVWRFGANDATHLATDRPLMLGDLRLEPGTYTLFLLPTANEWTLIVNRGTDISGLERNPAQDVGRTPMLRETAAQPAEQFTIELVPAEDGRGTLVVRWDRLRGTVPLRAVGQ